jgi:hypothetical protein
VDFLKPRPHRDPMLGELVRQRGYWRGTITLGDHGAVPLLLAGPRAAPAEAGLGLARELASRYAALRPVIARALFEHYEPYAEAVAAGEEDGDAVVPGLPGPGDVWAHAALVQVRIEPLGGTETVELAYRTAWDTEHTLGARFQGWALVELNGSIL